MRWEKVVTKFSKRPAKSHKMLCALEGFCKNTFLNVFAHSFIFCCALLFVFAQFACFCTLLSAWTCFCALLHAFVHFGVLLHTFVCFCTLLCAFAHFCVLLHTSACYVNFTYLTTTLIYCGRKQNKMFLHYKPELGIHLSEYEFTSFFVDHLHLNAMSFCWSKWFIIWFLFFYELQWIVYLIEKTDKHLWTSKRLCVCACKNLFTILPCVSPI